MEKFNTAITADSAALSWNAVMLALGILTAVVVSEILVKKRKAYKDLALDACIIGIIAGLLGARLFSALSGKIAFSEFITLSAQGLNLPGALLFCGVAIAVYTKIKKLDTAEAFDILLPGAFFGMAIGRWSDFFLCDGLGPLAGANVPKFFPLVTFTKAYFADGQSVAYAVFFLDFLICAALGIAALLLSKKLEKGRAARITAIAYLFLEFILEWLRDGSTRQIVFGDVRFNQIVLMAMLLFMIGLSLYCARQKANRPAEEKAEPEPITEPDEPQEEPEAAEVPEVNEAEEMTETPDEASEDGLGGEADGGDGGDA